MKKIKTAIKNNVTRPIGGPDGCSHIAAEDPAISETNVMPPPTDIVPASLAETQVKSMSVKSMAASMWNLERESVLRELHKARVRLILQYMEPEGGELTLEEAIKRVKDSLLGGDYIQEVESILTKQVDTISWDQIDQVVASDPRMAEKLWKQIKEEARKEFESGHKAAEVFESTDWKQDPWSRARYIAIRESFVEQWNPQGGIDYSMIDMLTITFAMWMHWTEEHIRLSTTESIVQPTGTERDYAQKYGGEWMPQRVTEKEAVEHAALMADRFRRAYQATLRQMRDWRRYSVPVTINNAQQVNIAADGGQQVNMQSNQGMKKRSQ